jgi:hypothetical protein
MCEYLRDDKSKKDKFLSDEMIFNITSELVVPGSYSNIIPDPKKRATIRHNIKTMYTVSFEGSIKKHLCHNVNLVRRPGLLYHSELSNKECLAITKSFKEQYAGSTETPEYLQAPVTSLEDSYTDFHKGHVDSNGKHLGRDATYSRLNNGVSDQFSKALCQKLIMQCQGCKDRAAVQSQSGRAIGQQRVQNRKINMNDRATKRAAAENDLNHAEESVPRELKRSRATYNSPLPIDPYQRPQQYVTHPPQNNAAIFEGDTNNYGQQPNELYDRGTQYNIIGNEDHTQIHRQQALEDSDDVFSPNIADLQEILNFNASQRWKDPVESTGNKASPTKSPNENNDPSPVNDQAATITDNTTPENARIEQMDPTNMFDDDLFMKDFIHEEFLSPTPLWNYCRTRTAPNQE